MTVRVRLRRVKEDPHVLRFRAARADQVELRVQQIRAGTATVEAAAEMVQRHFRVVREVLLAIPGQLTNQLDELQRASLMQEIDRALSPLQVDPMQVVQEAIVQ